MLFKHKRVIFLIIPGGVQISPFVLLHVGFSSFLVWWEWLSFSFFFFLLVLVPEGTTHYGVIFCGGFCKKSARLTIISSFCGSFSADVVCHYIWGDTHHEWLTIVLSWRVNFHHVIWGVPTSFHNGLKNLKKSAVYEACYLKVEKKNKVD